jgi:hypothetical protein
MIAFLSWLAPEVVFASKLDVHAVAALGAAPDRAGAGPSLVALVALCAAGYLPALVLILRGKRQARLDP